MIVDTPEGESVAVACHRCTGQTSHDILCSVKDTEEIDEVGYWSTRQYFIVRCRGCDSICFRLWRSTSEEVDHDTDGKPTYFSSTDVYPPRLEGRKGIAEMDLWLLEEKLRAIYHETNVALLSGLPVLAGIGMRAIVETVCKEKGASGRDLKEKIDKLAEMKVLTPNGAIILHHVRTLGNKSAHEVKPHSSEQLALAMEVVDHLIKDVYILPKHAASRFGVTGT
ncbi:DUF4145 domain-containing protein [Acidovorax sp. LjRoot118]|uniref:DUF4145 domain-containing protein n=1 Tax=Acidovorax sp. LjRoot118 TaxID=3342256 RepID=UPI003ECD466A